MSSIEAITIPKWGMTMTEGTITSWLVKPGDIVNRGQEVLEIETTKVTNVLEASATGKLRRVVLDQGITAPVGAIAGVIADEDATEEEIDAFVQSYADRAGAGVGEENAAPAAKKIEVAGGTLNILEAGPQTDDVLVFVHGFGGDLTTWLFNQPDLAEEIRTTSIDLPGHGESSPVDSSAVLQKIVETVDEAIGTVNGRVHLVGHSFGGAVATAIAQKRSDQLGSLTLIASIGLGADINRSFLTDFIAAERRRPLQDVLKRLFSDPSKITSDMVEGTLRFKRLEGVPEALTAIANEIADDNGQRQSINDALATIKAPVLLLWGEKDEIVPLPDKSKLPENVTLQVIENVGHMPQMEAASLVNKAIKQSIAGK